MRSPEKYPSMSNLLTIKEVALRLKVKENTIRVWQMKGKITFIKLPQGVRIKEEWLEGWLNKRTVKAKG
jgi:excisionase family DNA binding protein